MIFNLQLLRAIAAILVVTHHLNRVLLPTALDERWFNPGMTGVDIFFVVSGFVMVQTMSRHPVGASDFVVNRLIRVVPMYWIFTLALATVWALLPSLFATTRISSADLVRSLLFVPYQASSGVVNPVLIVGWTLNYEMLFYGMFAASIVLVGRDVRRVVAVTVAALVALVAAGLVLRPEGVVATFYTAPIIAEFAAGMMLGLIWRRDVTLRASWALVLLLGGSAAMVALSMLAPGLERGLAFGVPATAIVAGALWLDRCGWRWQGRMGQLLGASSYSLYLTHDPVVMAVSKLSLRIDVAAVAWLLAAIAVILSVLIGIVVHMLVERPLTTWLRGVARHRPMAVERLDPSA